MSEKSKSVSGQCLGENSTGVKSDVIRNSVNIFEESEREKPEYFVDVVKDNEERGETGWKPDRRVACDRPDNDGRTRRRCRRWPAVPGPAPSPRMLVCSVIFNQFLRLSKKTGGPTGRGALSRFSKEIWR